jgi:hypothetical protein
LLMAGHGRAATNGLSLSNGRMGGPEKLKRGAGWRRKRGLKGNADATRPCGPCSWRATGAPRRMA